MKKIYWALFAFAFAAVILGAANAPTATHAEESTNCGAINLYESTSALVPAKCFWPKVVKCQPASAVYRFKNASEDGTSITILGGSATACNVRIQNSNKPASSSSCAVNLVSAFGMRDAAELESHITPADNEIMDANLGFVMSLSDKNCQGSFFKDAATADLAKVYENAQAKWQAVSLESNIVDISPDGQGNVYALVLETASNSGNAGTIFKYKDSKLIEKIPVAKDVETSDVNKPNRIFADKIGNLWLWNSPKTNNKTKANLYSYTAKTKKWKIYEDKAGGFGQIKDIAQNNAGLWLTTSKTVVLFNFKAWKVYSPKEYTQGGGSWNPEQLSTNSNAVYFSDGFGSNFSIFKNNKFYYLGTRLLTFSFPHFSIDSKNTLWSFDSLYNNKPISIRRVVFDEKNPKNYKVKDFSAKDGLSEGVPDSLGIDKNNNVWVAIRKTPSGSPANFSSLAFIAKYDGKKWSSIKAVEGLDNDGVNKIFFDASGKMYVWFSGGHGLYKVTVK